MRKEREEEVRQPRTPEKAVCKIQKETNALSLPCFICAPSLVCLSLLFYNSLYVCCISLTHCDVCLSLSPTIPCIVPFTLVTQTRAKIQKYCYYGFTIRIIGSIFRIHILLLFVRTHAHIYPFHHLPLLLQIALSNRFIILSHVTVGPITARIASDHIYQTFSVCMCFELLDCSHQAPSIPPHTCELIV